MTRPRTRSRTAVAALVAVLIGGAAALAPTSAWAAASVTVSGEGGAATADPDYATDVTVTGSGFQSIRNGFGGVYVLFGWVDSGWRPSAGGVVGADYRYVPDSESKDNAGFQRFVAFPGSDTESAAHAVMSDDGSWSVDMVVPGAVFESRDRDGNVSEVDCREVTCGIITIGAHGVKNANNETFTAISFSSSGASSSGSSSGSGSGSGGAASGGTATSGGTAAAPTTTEVGAVRVGVLSATVDAGNSLAFTGQGFTAGEQVVGTLDNGLVSVGPLTAGAQGEVAGVMPVPQDARGGTHLLTLTGAASGATAESEFSVVAAVTTIAAEAEDPVPSWLYLALLACIVIAVGLLLASGIVAIVRATRRRRARRKTAAETALPAAAEAPSPAVSMASPPAAPATTVLPQAPATEVRDSAPHTATAGSDAPTVELTVARP